MSWAAIILISLLTSIIGGLLAGWLVIRKTEYNLKRAHAKQIYVDFLLLSDQIFLSLYNHIYIIDNEVLSSVRPSLNEVTKETLRDFFEKLHSWLRKDLEGKLSICDKNNVVESIDIVINESMNRLDQFFQKYPLQIAYFDDLYGIETWLSVLRRQSIPKNILLQVELDVLRNYIQSMIPQILSILGLLKSVHSHIESLRYAKSWSWRILRE